MGAARAVAGQILDENQNRFREERNFQRLAASL
jgi:hypothetical protein